MFIETSSPRVPRDKARLTSPMVTPGSNSSKHRTLDNIDCFVNFIHLLCYLLFVCSICFVKLRLFILVCF